MGEKLKEYYVMKVRPFGIFWNIRRYNNKIIYENFKAKKLLKKLNDGVQLWLCSDNSERNIPSFAIQEKKILYDDDI